MSQPPGALALQLLEWVAGRPRTYAEAMEAWRSTCPRLTVWEDALAAGLVRVENGDSRDRCAVSLTSRGRAVLDAQGPRAGSKRSSSTA